MADKQKVSQKQKAAAIIVALGPDNASEVYKYMKDSDIEKISMEVTKLERLQADDLSEAIQDFYGLCYTQKAITEGGVEYARAVLEKAFGIQLANSYMDRIAKLLKGDAFEFIRKTDYKNLLNVLQNEHLQTIALVLSYASSDQSSSVLSELPKDKRISVVERIAKLDRAFPDAVKIVEKVIENRISAMSSVESIELGGISYVADMMNHVDRSTEKHIFDELSIKDPVLAEEIRKKMFVFEDIAYLDAHTIQTFIREVDFKDIAIALKSTIKEVSDAFFKNMSTRMRESVETDMEYMTNVRMHDVETAQQNIVSVIRKLEEEGKLVISKGKDDLIV